MTKIINYQLPILNIDIDIEENKCKILSPYLALEHLFFLLNTSWIHGYRHSYWRI